MIFSRLLQLGQDPSKRQEAGLPPPPTIPFLKPYTFRSPSVVKVPPTVASGSQSDSAIIVFQRGAAYRSTSRPPPTRTVRMPSGHSGRRFIRARWSGVGISNPNPRHHRQVANRVRRVKNHALDFRTPSNRIPGRIAVTHPITLPRSLIKPEHVLALGTCVEQLGDTSIGKAGRSRSTQVRLRQSRSKRLLAILPLYSYRSAV